MAVEGWELVLRGPSVQVDIAAAVLEANGIPAQTFEDTPYGPLMQARLFVPSEHLEAAQELLNQQV